MGEGWLKDTVNSLLGWDVFSTGTLLLHDPHPVLGSEAIPSLTLRKQESVPVQDNPHSQEVLPGV